MNYIRTTATFFSLIFLPLISVNATTNDSGWRAFLENEPLKAREIFLRNVNNSDKAISGEANRGLSLVYNFLGHSDTSAMFMFRGYLSDREEILISAGLMDILPFGREHTGHSIKEGYRALKELSRDESIYNSNLIQLLADRYVNDGNLRRATRLIRDLGIVRDFRMIGPFENISGSGFKRAYPPENELDFSATYNGKDGTEARWFPFINKEINGWLFTEHNYNVKNATLYYYSNIYSDSEQSVFIGFGASAAFKISLNDTVILADSVFRNTGIDMFMQRVTLNRGDNKLLIKLCHEHNNSNFLVRFFDETGKALSSISSNNDPGNFQIGRGGFANLTNSPLLERIEEHLLKRLEKDESDFEAALLLMRYYNITDLTDKGQQLARQYITIFPQSSLLYKIYSESLARSRKVTEAQTALKTAYRHCKLNFSAWHNELQILGNSASPSEVMEFIQSSPEQFKTTSKALLYKFGYYASINDQSETLRILEMIEKNYLHVSYVAAIISGIYSNHGNIQKAETILRNYLLRTNSAKEIYAALSNVYLKSGQKGRALSTYMQSLRYSPVSPWVYYRLANIALQERQYTNAHNYIDKALEIMPASAPAYSLKGSIYNAQERKEEAKEAFRTSIRYAYHSFDAWAQLLPLEGRADLPTLTPIPDPSEIIESAEAWEGLAGENGAILSFVKDVFLYPSRCTRERYFLMVHLPTQAAIDNWKEYNISFNSFYQKLNITRALSRSADKNETPADINRNQVVFKTLQPGDNILLEWTLENYFQSNMAKHAWGEHDFNLHYPVFDTRLRLVTPIEDTIPYTIQGESISVNKDSTDQFVITEFTRQPYKNPPGETFSLLKPPGSPKVSFSTFDSWSNIADWYCNVTENKLEQTTELKALVDSLTGGIDDPFEKVREIHSFITSSIRYSFVPFRQSGWIPQRAGEVLASRIGDCKDMSSLGKSLLDYAGIQSELVLVNTRDYNSIFPSYIGPNFNHCILSYTIDGKRYFVDMTDNTLSIENLPRMDQGALALVIREGNDSLINLPVDTPERRTLRRVINSQLEENGTLTQQVEATATGVITGALRSAYRFLSHDEQRKEMHKSITTSFPTASLDSFYISEVDSLKDTLFYNYRFIAKNAAQLSGTTTALLTLNMPDRIKSENFPNEENRHYDIDMLHTWFGVGTFSLDGTLVIPEGWRLANTPDKVELSGEWGSYSLSVTQQGERIVFRRDAKFNFSKPVSAQESEEIRSLLSKIAQADNVQLMFYTK